MFMTYLRAIPTHLKIIFGESVALAGSLAKLNNLIAVILLSMRLKTLVNLITYSVNPLTILKTSEVS